MAIQKTQDEPNAYSIVISGWKDWDRKGGKSDSQRQKQRARHPSVPVREASPKVANPFNPYNVFETRRTGGYRRLRLACAGSHADAAHEELMAHGGALYVRIFEHRP